MTGLSNQNRRLASPQHLESGRPHGLGGEGRPCCKAACSPGQQNENELVTRTGARGGLHDAPLVSHFLIGLFSEAQDSLSEPECDEGCDADSREKGVGAAAVAGCDTPPVLQAAEGVLDAVPLPMQRLVTRKLSPRISLTTSSRRR